MRKLLFLVPVILLMLGFLREETISYPKNYFRSPVDFPIRLSGTFGELRSGHFHSGIDIKSIDGKRGHAIRAVADGYVSRIKVRAGGYGNALYIKHPNGYTSVYAHMDRYKKEIQQYVKRQQYKRQSFSVDLYLKKGQFPVKKGEQVGYMGNTGRSSGPHLHFELRDSKNSHPINPLLFGLKMEDTKRPRIHQIKVYYFDDNKELFAEKIYDVKSLGHGKYVLKKDILEVDADYIGFAVKVYDHHNKVKNWNGIYSLEMKKNGAPVYYFDFESFSFDRTRYINAHLDYKEQVTKKAYFNRCFKLPNNRLSIYSQVVDNGLIKLEGDIPLSMSFVAKDVAGNKATLNFTLVKGDEDVPRLNKSYNYQLYYNEENIIDAGSFYAKFKKGTLYENLDLSFDIMTDDSDGFYSPVYKLHDYTVPVQRYFTIGIDVDQVPAEKMKKALVAYCDKDGKNISYGGKIEDGKIWAKARNLGDYCVMIDDEPPSVKPIKFKHDMRGASTMVFKVTDNFGVAGKAHEVKFRAYVDDKWILMDHNIKKDYWEHHFDGRIKHGKHQLRIIAVDDRGNETIYDDEFRY